MSLRSLIRQSRRHLNQAVHESRDGCGSARHRMETQRTTREKHSLFSTGLPAAAAQSITVDKGPGVKRSAGTATATIFSVNHEGESDVDPQEVDPSAETVMSADATVSADSVASTDPQCSELMFIDSAECRREGLAAALKSPSDHARLWHRQLDCPLGAEVVPASNRLSRRVNWLDQPTLWGIPILSIDPSVSDRGIPVGVPGNVRSLTGSENQHDAYNRLKNVAVGTTAVISTSLSVGYVSSMLQGGSLSEAFVSALSTWQTFDPLPVYESWRDTTRDDSGSLLALATDSVAVPFPDHPSENPRNREQ